MIELGVGQRFRIEARAGSGGMGTVYRALDQQTAQIVAIKVLHGCKPSDLERFSRETHILAELKHPAIVQYIAHGTTEANEPYLVMEWLQGHDLGQRLACAALTLLESVTLARRLAETLAAVHATGIIHRDIKPTNIFLCDGHIDHIKLIDFGIARLTSKAAAAITQQGLGTPGYVAPEQARGERDIDARADIFSLGCVLFECLTGQPPFTGDHVMAVLAKVLFEQAPPLRELCPKAPVTLEQLVARTLSKLPSDRPASALEVARELSALGPLDDSLVVQTISLPKALTEQEQRLVSVVLIGSEWEADTLLTLSADTAAQNPAVSVDTILQSLIPRHGGQLARLAQGTYVITWVGTGAATDQAALAARCALALRAELPGRHIALATGRGSLGHRAPMGEVIDRAATVLHRAQTLRTAAARHRPEHQQSTRIFDTVAIDELTQRLLGHQFDFVVDDTGTWLHGEKDFVETTRTLLGQPTAFVGRERELAALCALIDECIDESVAHAIIVTSPAGVGKSRLRQELLLRVQSQANLEIWTSRGDAMRAFSPFGLLGQIIKSAAQLRDDQPLDLRQRKLFTRVSRHVPAPMAARITEFLGEMVGTPFDDHDNLQLRAARQDPILMGDQMRRAWVDFIQSEVAAHPLMLILEDLHWGDQPTVDYVDAALRLLREQPLIVFALGRPELRDVFPTLFSERNVTEVPLADLSRKASQRLVRQALGDQVPDAVLATVVEHAAGNAFFLEELIRAVAEGRHDEWPDTVLAMVQSRLERLDQEARRVLRAASILGDVFWSGAVATLLGLEYRQEWLDNWLDLLERKEWITRSKTMKFQGQTAYSFRHALVRDVAYGMLTDEDRVLGHRLAGQWLEASSEKDAAVVARHFERGLALDRAVVCYGRAAVQALEGNDFAATIAHVERAVACGASGQACGQLLLLRAEAHRWRAEVAEAETWALEAMRLLPQASNRWYTAMGEVAIAARMLGHKDHLIHLANTFKHLDDDNLAPEDRASLVAGMARTAQELYFMGMLTEAELLYTKIDTMAHHVAGDPAVNAQLSYVRAWHANMVGDTSGDLKFTLAAIDCAVQAGDARAACNHRSNVGFVLNELGAYDQAAQVLRAALVDAQRMGLKVVAAAAKNNLGVALARLGRLDEAATLEREAIDAFAAHGHRRMEGGSLIYLADILRLQGQLDQAEQHARKAMETLATTPSLQPKALATLAMILLTARRLDAAAQTAEQAFQMLQSMGQVEEGDALVRLAYAETLDALGHRTLASQVIQTAWQRIQQRASNINDLAYRQSFLQTVPENARTGQLALRWPTGCD